MLPIYDNNMSRLFSMTAGLDGTYYPMTDSLQVQVMTHFYK